MPRGISELARPVTFRRFHSREFQFSNPVWCGQVPGLIDSFLVLEHQVGRIWLLEKNPEHKTLFLDLGTNVSSNGARGLLGLAFHPKFPRNRQYYLALHRMEDGKSVPQTLALEAAPDLKHDSGKPPRVLLRFNGAT